METFRNETTSSWCSYARLLSWNYYRKHSAARNTQQIAMQALETLWRKFLRATTSFSARMTQVFQFLLRRDFSFLPHFSRLRQTMAHAYDEIKNCTCLLEEAFGAFTIHKNFPAVYGNRCSHARSPPSHLICAHKSHGELYSVIKVPTHSSSRIAAAIK